MKYENLHYSELDKDQKFKLFMVDHSRDPDLIKQVYNSFIENINLMTIARLIADSHTIVGYDRRDQIQKQVAQLVEKEIINSIEYVMDELQESEG